jgi:hypothetical protein
MGEQLLPSAWPGMLARAAFGWVVLFTAGIPGIGCCVIVGQARELSIQFVPVVLCAFRRAIPDRDFPLPAAAR